MKRSVIEDKIIVCKAIDGKIRCYGRDISEYVEGWSPIFRNVDKVYFDGKSIQVENNTPILCKVKANFIECHGKEMGVD